MNNTRVSKAALALMLLFPTMAVRPAAAQIVNLVRINLPFDVTLSGTTLPSGEYTVQSATGSSGVPILMFRPDKGKTVEVIARQISMRDNAGSPRTEVVVGTQGHNLEELWIQGQPVGYEFGR